MAAPLIGYARCSTRVREGRCGWRHSSRHMGAADSSVMRDDKRTVRELEHLLDRIADRIVDSGTQAESGTLCAMASAAQEACPGAAAALVDWNGSEIARLRAFGIVHGVVLRALATGARLRLLEEILGCADLALAG